MRYLIGLTEKEIKKLSRDIAKAQGCKKRAEDVTEFWFGWRKHPVTGEIAMEVPAEWEYLLKPKWEKQLVDKVILETDGWFMIDEML